MSLLSGETMEKVFSSIQQFFLSRRIICLSSSPLLLLEGAHQRREHHTLMMKVAAAVGITNFSKIYIFLQPIFFLIAADYF